MMKIHNLEPGMCCLAWLLTVHDAVEQLLKEDVSLRLGAPTYKA